MLAMPPEPIERLPEVQVSAFFSRSLCRGRRAIELRAFRAHPRGAAQRTFSPLANPQPLWDFTSAHATVDIYFGVATRRDNSSGKPENCLALPALFADLDFKDSSELEVRNTLAGFELVLSILISSGGGLQAYWLFRHPIDLTQESDAAGSVLRRLTRPSPRSWLRGSSSTPFL
jgi:hypothetical protein